MSIYNATSTIGTVLGRFADWYGEWSMVDAFKQSRTFCSGILYGAWYDGRTLVTDEYGWPTELESGQVANTLMFGTGETFYPSGRYHVFYDGTGTIAYSGGATKNVGESSAGHDVVDVLSANGAIILKITATDPGDTGDYIRNIKVIMPGGVSDTDPHDWTDDEDQDGYTNFYECYETHRWHPAFLAKMRYYKTLRFLNWQYINEADGRGITTRTWADRPLVTDAQYQSRGVPVEIMCDLCNTLEADGWFLMHHTADDTYVTGFAAVVETELDAGLLAYVEHSNETWNGQFAQAAYCRERGLALGLSTDATLAKFYYHSMRSVEMFDLWRAAFGDGSDRVVRVMASQAANSWTATQVLSYGNAYLKTDVLAIAPYFGGYSGTTRQADLEAMTTAGLLAELESVCLPQSLGWMTANKTVADTYSVDLVAYEGGLFLVWDNGHTENATINALFDAAAADAGMNELYDAYLASWFSAGGVAPFCHFVNCSAWSKYGRWGALEYQTQTTSPRWSALVDFAGGTPPEEEEPEPEPVEETDWTGTGDEAEAPSYDEFTLGWIRRRLVEETGWTHLVVDAENGDYSDNGCDQYIMDAQAWLDRRMNYPKGRRTFYIQLPVGQSLVTFTRPRYIDEVWTIDDDGNRFPLEKLKLADLKGTDYYPEADTSTIDSGCPAYWSPAPIGLAPEQMNKGVYPVSSITLSGTNPVSVTTSRAHTFVTGDSVIFPATGETVELTGTYTITKVSDTVFTLNGTNSSLFTAYVSGGTASNITEGWADLEHLYFGRHFPLQGIIVMPPNDTARTLMVVGEWYSYRMTLDDDRSVWTYQPDILIAAARGIIELRRHQVRDRAELYFGYADKELSNLNYDLIAEETSGPMEIDC